MSTVSELTSVKSEEARERIPVALIIPVCDEEACIGAVVAGSREWVVSRCGGVIAVGLNGTTDGSAEQAAREGALVGEVTQRGYGHGCLAGICAVEAAGYLPEAYLFAAGDGANAPEDLMKIWQFYDAGEAQGGWDLVLGERTWRQGPGGMRRSLARTLPNLALGLWAAMLGGRYFLDLAPLRVIRREFFESMRLEEYVWGWTIEAQVKAALLGGRIGRLPIPEGARLAGEQKVSGQGLLASARIGMAIAAAGLRSRRRAQELVRLTRLGKGS